MDLPKNLQATIIVKKLIGKGDHVLVGVSGGADSIGLLYALNEIKHKIGFQILVAHFNHNVRSDSKKDEDFVKALAEKLNLPFITKTSQTLKTKKGSFEENAREERFDFLKTVAKKHKCTRIALAHNQNDQSETVLMRILRGTGLRGLKGILMERDLQGMTIIRPFLNTSRDDIETFLKKRKLSWREDSTNKDTQILRNKIRHKLIPQLRKEYNPNVDSILCDLAQNSACDYQFIEEHLKKAIQKTVIQKSSNEVLIDLKSFLKQHPSLQNMILQEALLLVKGDHKPLAAKHIKELMDLIKNKPVKTIVHLPQKVTVRKFDLKITLQKTK